MYRFKSISEEFVRCLYLLHLFLKTDFEQGSDIPWSFDLLASLHDNLRKAENF